MVPSLSNCPSNRSASPLGMLFSVSSSARSDALSTMPVCFSMAISVARTICSLSLTLLGLPVMIRSMSIL